MWIFYSPSSDNGWTGFLGLGGSVRLKSTKPTPGDSCAEFYEIEPRGYVCLNAKTTLDPNDPEYVAIRRFAPRLDTPFPHHYGESRGAPRYVEIPTPDQQMRREYQLQQHLEAADALRQGRLQPDSVPAGLRGVDTALASATPPPELALLPRVQEERDWLKPLSTIAWSEQFDASNRTWLVTADLALVPKDRVTPYPRSAFQGVHLHQATDLPIAFVRERERPKYRRDPDGRVRTAASTWPRLTHLALTNEVVRADDRTYLVTREDGLLVDELDVTVARPNPTTPWGAFVQGVPPEQTPLSVQRVAPPQGGRRTWVEVSVLGGWMIAYEDTQPVFATLISPGRGGIPERGRDPLETASTPLGTFRIDGKFWTATMANDAFVHSDVPFAQNFHGPHALHMAYWHDQWGEKKSGGCINLSPEDARWFFLWTEPPIPDGWHGMRSDAQAGPATIVWVHK